MINYCPLCRLGDFVELYSQNAAPIFSLVKTREKITSSHFAPLKIVACKGCSHIFNHAFSSDLADDMYGTEILTNKPVDSSMFKNLEHIANWVGSDLYIGKEVLEVGGGTGHFARLLARRAKKVRVFEPSSGLTKESLPETNIELTNLPFVYSSDQKSADLVICRQVLEHVASPVALLRDIQRVTARGGCVYVEVPRAEFILENEVIIEFHNAHVQYFYEALFPYFAKEAGLAVERSWLLKGGHDMGFILKPSGKTDLPELPAKTASGIRQKLDSKIASHKSRLESFSKFKVALYGANWQGATFYNLFDDLMPICVFDDNSDYDGYALYRPSGTLNVELFPSSLVNSMDTIIVTAHLHFEVIDKKLRDFGFKGRIVNALDLAESNKNMG